jgi:hypothetical protein
MELDVGLSSHVRYPEGTIDILAIVISLSSHDSTPPISSQS